MKFFYQLEKKFGKYAVRDLPRYIAGMYAIGAVLSFIMPSFYRAFLSLNGDAIVHGQIWRVFTFLLYPPFAIRGMGDIIGIFLNALIIPTYYFLGSTLERVWGSFRFNIYFLLGVIGHVAGAVAVYFLLGVGTILRPVYLNFSLFIAFALMFPNMEFFIWGLLPIKIKYLAVAETALYIYSFVTGDIVVRLEIGLSLLNVLVFFVLTRKPQRFSPKEIRRRQEFKAQTKIKPAGRTRHRCAVCGRTEEDGAQMEFRYCSKCAGSYEYCQDHLYTHQHVTEKK
ncbi:MAG: rhomboid family intramembrane serine protease [Lachnospiraceae bacterium]|jgi:hypothetical protein|nr:rhomboid family intramembrane serine protease [Lachnospiraceae bacterium]